MEGRKDPPGVRLLVSIRKSPVQRHEKEAILGGKTIGPVTPVTEYTLNAKHEQLPVSQRMVSASPF